MTPANYVVDASVGTMLYLNEEHSLRARTLFSALVAQPQTRLYVPDLFYIEMANVLLKAVRTGRCARDAAAASIVDLCSLSLLSVQTQSLAGAALGIAQAKGISAYDACYVALSDRVRVPLVTADQRLVNMLAGTSHRIQWLGNMPESDENGRSE